MGGRGEGYAAAPSELHEQKEHDEGGEIDECYRELCSSFRVSGPGMFIAMLSFCLDYFCFSLLAFVWDSLFNYCKNDS